jgi:hypothetical protein
MYRVVYTSLGRVTWHLNIAPKNTCFRMFGVWLLGIQMFSVFRPVLVNKYTQPLMKNALM